MKKALLLSAVAALALSSCAPRYNPNAQKPDVDLSCSEVRSEITRAESARAEATSNRGLSTQNVAWAIFFIPGVVANEYTNDQVQKAADERIGKLNQLYAVKRCN
ncbi:hypothetical protein [Deinococcus marmoris]|uniref:Lipoprotein n=1 Tax=Deinococcus marmoris TaxID=249408 RepID=A0A1U7NWL1_9DEIO|nr:hypothetical protein [Deinococcus marmoris]OLV17299.1 hypothetical protein BOO71_0009511 [Deinococcus marmoris]OLV18640.1 hypothetical protein BOO71_0004960 [Deinococcus marmoris]